MSETQRQLTLGHKNDGRDVYDPPTEAKWQQCSRVPPMLASLEMGPPADGTSGSIAAGQP